MTKYRVARYWWLAWGRYFAVIHFSTILETRDPQDEIETIAIRQIHQSYSRTIERQSLLDPVYGDPLNLRYLIRRNDMRSRAGCRG